VKGTEARFALARKISSVAVPAACFLCGLVLGALYGGSAGSGSAVDELEDRNALLQIELEAAEANSRKLSGKLEDSQSRAARLTGSLNEIARALGGVGTAIGGGVSDAETLQSTIGELEKALRAAGLVD